MAKFWTSKKFWVTLISGALIAFKNELGVPLTDEQLIAFAGVVASYLLGQSHVDAKKEVVKAEEVKKNPPF